MACPLLKDDPNMNVRRSQRGYSLVEMLAVVAIIGIMSLIVVPNFASYYRSIKLKTALRRLTNDLRAARQRAVARNSLTMVSYSPGTQPATYSIWESTDSGTNWTQLGSTTRIEKPITINDTTVAASQLTDSYKSDGLTDAVFKSDGTALLPANVTTGQIIVKTGDKISISSYNILITPTGKISTQ